MLKVGIYFNMNRESRQKNLNRKKKTTIKTNNTKHAKKIKIPRRLKFKENFAINHVDFKTYSPEWWWSCLHTHVCQASYFFGECQEKNGDTLLYFTIVIGTPCILVILVHTSSLVNYRGEYNFSVWVSFITSRVRPTIMFDNLNKLVISISCISQPR